MGDLSRGVLEGFADLVRIWDGVCDGAAFGVEDGLPPKDLIGPNVAAILMRGVFA